MAMRMNRRTFLRCAGAGATVLAAGSCALTAERKSEGNADRPNVLFIAVDDLNDWIGCLGGHPQTRSPNIDRLARRGVLFRNAQCAAPACNPSRAALLTGVRPSTSGVYHNPQPWRPVMPDVVTLPQHFMAHGYRVTGSGKIFHGRYADPPSWQEYWPSKTRTRPGDPMPKGRPLNGIPNTAHFDWGPVEARDEEMGDWQVADWAREQLASPQADPFFLAVGIFRPHLPWYVPPKYFEMFPPEKVVLPKVKKTDLEDVPELGRRMARPQGDHKKVVETDNWARAVSGYLASIAFADACVGRVLDALDASPYADNTIIVLWGDHGWHLGEKLHWRKFALWEEAAHAPLMMAGPGIARGGCTRPVSFMDIYPTLADLCGLGPNERLEGNSLRPLLRDPKAEWERPALTTHGRNNHSLRSERWRYIRYADGSEELYDHARDEMEWTNLAGDPACDAIKKRLARYLPEVNVPDAPREKRNRPKKKRKKDT
ncbi:MAG: sulfatase-like hydrolase/transferase [Phycisphaerae bacterium]